MKKKKNKINYKLNLLKNIRIYSMFYIILLELASPNVLLVIRKLLEFAQNNKYKVEKIIDYNS